MTRDEFQTRNGLVRVPVDPVYAAVGRRPPDNLLLRVCTPAMRGRGAICGQDGDSRGVDFSNNYGKLVIKKSEITFSNEIHQLGFFFSYYFRFEFLIIHTNCAEDSFICIHFNFKSSRCEVESPFTFLRPLLF